MRFIILFVCFLLNIGGEHGYFMAGLVVYSSIRSHLVFVLYVSNCPELQIGNSLSFIFYYLIREISLYLLPVYPVFWFI